MSRRSEPSEVTAHPGKRLLGRKLRVCLDLADLQDMPLLVRGNHQGPLVSVTSLPLHDVPPEVVAGGLHVLQQTVVMCRVLVERSAQIPRWCCGAFRWDGLLPPA